MATDACMDLFMDRVVYRRLRLNNRTVFITTRVFVFYLKQRIHRQKKHLTQNYCQKSRAPVAQVNWRLK